MSLRTKDCVEHLISWTVSNYDLLPQGDWDFVGEKRLRVIEKGHTRASNWSRRAIKKNKNQVYRVFECCPTVFKSDLMFLVIEDNDAIVEVQAGTRKDFEQYFNKIGFSWGW